MKKPMTQSVLLQTLRRERQRNLKKSRRNEKLKTLASKGSNIVNAIIRATTGSFL